ncbi:restriction endonuclease subunit S [Xanthomonas prunicola]|uniref:restriction endonuclease subunit S n=1 Tax=Xanthomonas prunicola TaxID=2053930 RepID=UPI0021FE76A3|nr:restriction endonuclease subunit S [Xanthomonas prunicola]
MCTLITDGTHHSPVNSISGEHPYITAKNIKKYGLDTSIELTYVSSEVHKEIYARCPVEFEDVLYIKDGATTGIAAINTLKEEFSLLSSVALLKCNRSAINPYFLKHWLNSPDTLRMFTGKMTGTAIKRVVLKQIREAEIYLPPLAEQKRIAQKLDALLAQVDTLKARIDAIPALLKRFRSSIVESATRGSLTSDWRTLNSTTEWVKTVIGELIKEKPRNGYSPKPVDYETKTRSLSLSATTSGKFRPEFSKFIAETIPSGSHLWLEPGDILIQRANTLEYVGVSALFDGQTGNFIYPDLMMKCRAKPSVAPAFLQLVLNSKSVRKYFRDNATGTAGNMPKINQQTVVSAPVVLPMIEEQTEIVRRVEQLFAYAEQLEAKVATAQQRINALTQSLLAKAFRGELVPQDPSDEPASVLLQRIRAQRAAAPKPKRGRKAATS